MRLSKSCTSGTGLKTGDDVANEGTLCSANEIHFTAIWLLSWPLNLLNMERPLTPDEEHLIRWMLVQGSPEAQAFLPQLERAKATAWRCPCGCASINLSVDGLPERSGDLHILADFVFGADDDLNLSGAFVFEKSGVLAGLEVYGLAGEAPRVLPLPVSLRPIKK